MTERLIANKIIGVLWTYNSDVILLAKVIKCLMKSVNTAIVVDNGSRNFTKIEKVLKQFTNIVLIRLRKNTGVHALNIGIAEAIKMRAQWILLLDDDTLINPRILKESLELYTSLPENIRSRIATISLMEGIPSKWLQCRKKLIAYYGPWMFSGTLIKAELVSRYNILIRESFFLDQADFDFFWKIRNLGYYTTLYVDEGIKHRLGKPFRGPRIKIPLIGILEINSYENPLRYYYIIRNSTILLLEKKLSPLCYMMQLIHFFIPLAFVDGLKKALRTLVLGLAHGIFKIEGIIDPDIFEDKD